MKTLKILYRLLVLAFMLNTAGAYAQSDTSFIKKSINFWKDPVYYFSKIDVSKIPTKILLDKTYFTDDLFDFNGISKVKTGQISDFKTCYNQLRNAAFDTLLFKKPFERLVEINQTMSRYQKIIPIALVNIEYNQIKSEAFRNGVFFETDNNLNDQNATFTSYEKKRFFAASVLDSRIHGDAVTFMLDGSFYVSNIKDEQIQQFEIDFGDGSGFRTVDWYDQITVQYSSDCDYIESIIKMTVKDINNNEKYYYSHFTFLRTGSALVPEPDILKGSEGKSTSVTPRTFEYPIGSSYGSHVSYWNFEPISDDAFCDAINPCIIGTCHWGLCCNQTLVEYDVPTTVKIQGYILFNPNNPTVQNQTYILRRPIIICDGFDPDNKRDWYITQTDPDEDDPLLDKRGIYELLNGNDSPRYGGVNSAGVVATLQAHGYDIVVLNFIAGAGDIVANADNVIGCFNDIINSSYRDNETEEAVFIGPSMGGLISRIALAKMEKEEETKNKSHLVGQWISFDSPNAGANVPIGLQWSVYFLSLSSISASKADPGLHKLNSDAAKQMLLTHFSRLGSETEVKEENNRGEAKPNDVFYYLKDVLYYYKYPNTVLRTAISNGGKTKLFSDDGLQNVTFSLPIPGILMGCNAFNNTNSNSSAYYEIFDGHRPYEFGYAVYTNHQIGYDNAPGGFTDAQRGLNRASLIGYPHTNSSYDIATFMVTTSAFGIPVTSTNVYNTWDAYQGCDENLPNKIKTDFDKVHGMDDNEEHVRITTETKNYMVTLLEDDQQNIQRPRIRSLQNPITQNIYQPVLFKAYQTATFGSPDGVNKFIVNESADVNIEASNSIIFKPGFKVKAGAKLIAKIKETTIPSSSKSLTNNITAFNYLQVNNYAGLMHNYSNDLNINNNVMLSVKDNEKNIGSDNLTIYIYPNPANNFVNIELSHTKIDETIEIKAFDLIGKMVAQTDKKYSENIYRLNFSNVNQGVYFVHVSIGDKTTIKKITIVK